MTKLHTPVKSEPLYVQFTATDIRDLEVLLGMLESKVGQTIPVVDRILHKLENPIAEHRILRDKFYLTLSPAI